jgi:hypothetical protein
MEEYESISKQYAEVGKVLIETLKPMLERLAERLGKAIGETPRYLLYEAVHPRKKPRGSIRRERKKENEKD